MTFSNGEADSTVSPHRNGSCPTLFGIRVALVVDVRVRACLSRGRRGAIERREPISFFRGLFVGTFELRQVGVEFVGRGPALHDIAEHLVRAFRRPAADPEGDHQAGDDGAVGLNLDAVLVVAQQVSAAESMFELAEAAACG